jgi:FlaA1/EpsC-like NDP-sugar epimerase
LEGGKQMTYKKRIVAFVLLDSLIVLTSIYISYLIFIPDLHILKLSMLLITSLFLFICHHLFAFKYKLYHQAWKYASIGELLAIIKAVTFSVTGAALLQNIVFHNKFVRILLLTWMLNVLFIGGTRFFIRIIQDRQAAQPNTKRTLIIGAGFSGTMVVRQLLQSGKVNLKPVAFIDDDPAKYKLSIMGIPVIGNTSRIPQIVEQYQIENIVIAIPSLNRKELNRIFEECLKTKVKTQIMPKLEDLMTGKISVNQFREVEVEDLLGRDPVELDIASISEYISGKTVLVTGAGGSIGSEICRQIARFTPGKLVLLGHGENSIYNIDRELANLYKNQIEIVPVIADIQDRTRMFEVMESQRPDVVYHAAAHKHVPLMEFNPREAVKNNIFGTKNVAEAAEAYGVHTFVLISSDKAVNPPNVMGATKRMAEMVIQQLAGKSKTKFVAVRFGNVLGSNGSVIPLFKEQIFAGGPVTVTHPEMTRYFMTIPEASQLVIQSGALASGGEIFVLDMGEQVRIVDLAKNLIKLSGFSIEEIGIEYTGIRPGEKLYEELLNDNEVHPGHVFPKVKIGKAGNINAQVLNTVINRLLKLPDPELRDTLLKAANNQIELLSLAN